VRTQLRVGVIAAVLIGTAALSATPAHADDQAARLTSAERTAPANPVAGGPVTVAWSAEDDPAPGSGVSHARFRYENLNAEGKTMAIVEVQGQYAPLADGRSVATALLGPWTASGHYTLVEVWLHDRIGNSTHYLRNGSVSVSPQTSATPSPVVDFPAMDFDVDNPESDTAIPTVSDLRPVGTSLRAGEPVTLTSTVSDDRSGVAELAVEYTAPNGTTRVAATADPGLAPAGLASGLLPLGAPGGHWQATLVRVSDRAGNASFFFRDQQPAYVAAPDGPQPYAAQPAIDWPSLDIDVTPGAPDPDAPLISDVSREGPAQLHRDDDVIMHFTVSDASRVQFVEFSFTDASYHYFHVRVGCVSGRGTAIVPLPQGLDRGRVMLWSITAVDELWNARGYRRDGQAYTQGRNEPDAVPGIQLSNFDFDLVDGPADFAGHFAPQLSCVTAPKLPLNVPEAAQPGDVIPVNGQVLTSTDQPIAGGQVAVFEQPTGADSRLVGVMNTDNAGAYSTTATLARETTYVARFLGRAGVGGADAANSDRKLVRIGTPSSSPTPTATPSGSPAPVASAGSGTATTPPPGTAGAPPELHVPAVSTYGSTLPVVVFGRPHQPFQIWAYSRTSTTYRLVRQGTLDPFGGWTGSIRPATNTRLFAKALDSGAWLSSPTRAVQMRAAVSLRVSAPTSTGRRTFSGTAGPAIAGRLVSIYRNGTSGPQLFARVRTTSTGTYSLTVLAPRGWAVYDARTAATDRNAAGSSSGVGTS
jgi:hypothetical protein